MPRLPGASSGLILAVAAFAADSTARTRLEFTVEEDRGVARAGEPVRLPLQRGVNLTRARLWNITAGVEVPVQIDDRGLLMICTAPPRSVTRFRLETVAARDLGNSLVKVTGEDLAWTVETSHYVIDLRKNPGTGRNGQINTIYAKEPEVLLTRARPTSTLHLSPNAAASAHWAGVNRWDPPARYRAKRGALSFRLEREGPMPNVPALWVKTSYEFFASTPQIEVEESVEAKTEARVMLLRLCEWSVAPGADNPFSHIGWGDDTGGTSFQKKEGELELPFGLQWMAFASESRGFAFAAALERMETAALAHPASRFGGDPHYFCRLLIAAAKDKMVAIPAGAVYSTRYRIACFRAADPARLFAAAAEWGKGVRRPLQLRVTKWNP
jgi:hypothetical protein